MSKMLVKYRFDTERYLAEVWKLFDAYMIILGPWVENTDDRENLAASLLELNLPSSVNFLHVDKVLNEEATS